MSTVPLPMAELHLHIEGTFEPEEVFRIARRNGVALPWSDVDDLRRRYDFDDLQSFLDLYYSCMSVLRTRADFAELAGAYFARAHRAGVAHAEIFFDPQAHTSRGVAVDDVIDGLLDAFEQARTAYGMTGGLIMCFLRDRPVEEAMATLEAVAPRARELLGVGLDSAEVGYPPELFGEVFARARELGLHVVAHAGEEGPPAYVWQALRVGAERIDHGVRSMEDPELVAHLRDRRVPLTVCPLSNVRLRVVPELAAHPLPAMLAAGLLVTVHSDDPAYFGGYLDENLDQCLSALDLADDTRALLARNSIEASFADADRKTELLARLQILPGNN